MSGRLTEPGQDFELQFCRESGCEYYGEPEGCNHPNYVCPSNCYFTTVAERLQEYEDAEEQGLFVKLPCKVGDTVYWLDGFGDIRKCKVTGFRVYKDYITVEIQTENGYEFFMADECFDKFVFTNHEEADEALKGAENGGIN